MLEFKNDAEVMKMFKEDEENNQIIIFEGTVYNVKEYLPNHPGGDGEILPYLGMNIEEPFEEAEHTKSARKIFKDLPVVGKMCATKQNVQEKPQENGKQSEF